MIARETWCRLATFYVTLCLAATVLSAAVLAADNSIPPERVTQFNLNPALGLNRSEVADSDRGVVSTGASGSRRPVGSAVSTDAGIGKGESVDLTWDDAQYTTGHGRHISHWWNGQYGIDAAVSVHFAYRDLIDSTASNRIYYSGYNAYDALNGVWPRGVETGCDLQDSDPLGWGDIPSLDIMPNGRAVMAGMSALYRTMPGGGSLYDNMVFYQGSEFGCTYDPRTNLNVTWIDSSVYRPRFMVRSDGTYSRTPQVVSQWDGTNTIVHLLLGEESPGTMLNGDAYVSGLPYYSFVYFRKVGETSGSGTWSAGQIIDSLWFSWASMAAAPYPYTGVAITYTNPSYYGALLENEHDLDVWCRESFDRGISWASAYSVTNYANAIAGDPKHFTAWLETQAMFTTDGKLNVVWTAKPTFEDPYFDGFNWTDYDENIYHWEKTNGSGVPGVGDVVKVANGNFNDGGDYITGSFNTLHCGFGGSNAGYIANINLAECDGKLYCVWNQIHERANNADWRRAGTQPMPGVLDDCSYTGNRQAMANWEIMMSVKSLTDGTFWDNARNITNTYTPNCGVAGDPLAQGVCGSEYKPTVEKYGLDETGLSLNWPAATTVDPTADWETPYAGSWYLNLQYLDDQFPGPAYWGRTNPPATLNSIKWIRLACVEPVYAPQISLVPTSVDWPLWVQLGNSRNFAVTVVNDGNLALNVTEIGFDDNGGGWLGASVATLTVPAGVGNTRTFNIVVNAGALATTQWLDGSVWLKSDAVNNDSLSIPIHILAAADVESVAWDTVMSHQYMFDQFFEPVGECVALAVSNYGEMGWQGRGSVNLDYRESGEECGARDADAIYLKSGSPFAILATSSTGVGAELTCSYMDPNQADPNGWDPTPANGGIRSGTYANRYDSVYTGKFVNRDTTIAMEQVFYAPRSSTPATSTINFVICNTWFYSADGLPHNHLTVGNVIDWNVPSDSASSNTAGVSSAGFVYAKGTDTLGHDGCQSNTNRYATEAFGGGATKSETNANPCSNDPNDYYSINAFDQHIMSDTTHYRNGTDLVPDQPNPQVWWDEVKVPGSILIRKQRIRQCG